MKELKFAVTELSGARRDAAEKLMAEIEFLDATLGTLKESVTTNGAVIRIGSGTMKESPAMKSYNTTIQRYSLLFKQVVELLPKPREASAADPFLEFLHP